MFHCNVFTWCLMYGSTGNIDRAMKTLDWAAAVPAFSGTSAGDEAVGVSVCVAPITRLAEVEWLIAINHFLSLTKLYSTTEHTLFYASRNSLRVPTTYSK